MSDETKPRIWNKVRVVVDLDVSHPDQWYCEKIAAEMVQYLLVSRCVYVGDGKYYVDVFKDDKFPMMVTKVEAMKEKQ